MSFIMRSDFIVLVRAIIYSNYMANELDPVRGDLIIYEARSGTALRA